jgi:hypothetical protein
VRSGERREASIKKGLQGSVTHETKPTLGSWDISLHLLVGTLCGGGGHLAAVVVGDYSSEKGPVTNTKSHSRG